MIFTINSGAFTSNVKLKAFCFLFGADGILFDISKQLTTVVNRRPPSLVIVSSLLQQQLLRVVLGADFLTTRPLFTIFNHLLKRYGQKVLTFRSIFRDKAMCFVG